MRRILAALASALGLIVALVVTGSPTNATGGQLPPPTTSNHFVTNLKGDLAGALDVGFNVIDTGTSASTINALPDGVRALVWLGQKCPTAADATFRAKVDALKANPKVFGYYLSDEPHIADCPGGPAALATRADYVRTATNGAQRSFIVLSKVGDFRPFRPAATHVDLVGLDPYPCSVANPQCDIDKIDQRVNAALEHIPLRHVVPVYQAFGQENRASGHYYSLPTPEQMQAMIHRWADLVPNPVMDYAYGWGNQTSSNPTLVDSPELQEVFRSYFAGSTC